MVDYAEEISAVEHLFPGTFDMSGSWKYGGFFCLFVCFVVVVF